MMRKVQTTFMFLSIFLLMVLSACSSSSSGDANSEGQTEITFAETVPSDERTILLKKQIEDFENDNPDIKVNFQSIPVSESKEKLVTMAVAGKLPDVFEINNSWIGPLVVNNGLEDLTPYIDDFSNTEEISQSAIDLGKSYNDTLYWLPYGTYGIALYYNKQYFDEAGLEAPENLDEFYEAAKLLTNEEERRYGYAFRGGEYGFTHTLLWMLGAVGTESLFDENGKSILDSPEAIEALEDYAKLYWEGLVPPDSLNWGYKETVESFNTGNSAMLIQSNEVVNISQEKMGDNFDTALLPLGPSGKQFDTSGQVGYAIASTSKNKEAAAKLLEYLMSEEPNLEFTRATGFTPVLESIQEDPAFSEGPISVYKDQLNSEEVEFANLPTYLPEWSEFIVSFSTAEVQKLLLKEQTAVETATNLANYLNDALARWEEENE